MIIMMMMNPLTVAETKAYTGRMITFRVITEVPTMSIQTVVMMIAS